MIGTMISHYKILDKIGEGGMGIVYKAHDTKLDRTVALKFLPPHLTKSEEDRQRFIREAKAAAALNHPHICTIYSVEEHDGQQFISMEYIDGVTLRQRPEVGGQRSEVRSQRSETPATDNRPLATTIDYAIQIAEAITEAHEKGIVHRDIKPENIMVDAKNRIKVMDFGLAKLKGEMNLTKAGSTVGTVAYMSPEQIQGQEVDHRSDIFSFGVVLYEMLTGQTPFRGEHEAAMVYSIVNENPVPMINYLPDLHPEIIRIIERALEKDPGDRYQSAADMISELRRMRKKSSGIETVHPVSSNKTEHRSSGITVTMPALKSRTGFIVIGTAGLLVAGLIYFLTPSSPSRVAERDVRTIAVLPLENLSPDPDDQYFSDGVHEDIIIHLSRIAGIGVIARSSVLSYDRESRTIQTIARDLNVATVLEGSVRRSGDLVRVAVQLIDVESNRTLWADSYERNLTDLFTIQSSIAQEIASALRVNLSDSERERIEQRPTDIFEAYDLYVRAREYINSVKDHKTNIENGITVLNHAVNLDPEFAEAYALLSTAHASMYWYGYETSQDWIENAWKYAEKALQLQPDSPDAHLAMSYYYYFGFRNYEKAQEHISAAHAQMPNNAEIYTITAAIQRRVGKWDESTRNFEKALSLDPLNLDIRNNLMLSYLLTRQYEKARSGFRQMLTHSPDHHGVKMSIASTIFFETGDPTPLREFLQMYPDHKHDSPGGFLRAQYNIRDFDGLIQSVHELETNMIQTQVNIFPTSFYLGYAYRQKGEHELSVRYFNEALLTMRELAGEHENDARYHSNLGRIYACLGDAERALEEGTKAMELLPLEKDALAGLDVAGHMVFIYAHLGMAKEAVELLRKMLSIPGYDSVPSIRVVPDCDPIKDTPEFQQLIREFTT
jgi:eukaryotic-like serine/threonine-protein kinase